MKKYFLLIGLLSFLVLTVSSCGSKRMGGGKQKKNCNCGF